jgi:hypothetical protein
VGRSRVWLHTTGSLHIWYHLVLFGVLGALALRGGGRASARVVWVLGAVGLGFAMEALQARSNAAAIEWGDVQMDCFGVAFGCFVVWLLSGNGPKAR